MSKLFGAIVVVLMVVSAQVVWGQCVDITLTPTSVPSGQQGVVYGGASLAATGATAPVTFTTGSPLPTGMNLSLAGVLAGTPTVSGTFVVRVVATDVDGCLASLTVPLVIAPGAAPTITSADNVALIVGTAGSFTVTTTGTPPPTLTLGGDALPNGVTFAPSTGILSGTPASGTGGTYNLTFTATNGVPPAAVQNFTLTVNERPVVTDGGTSPSFTEDGGAVVLDNLLTVTDANDATLVSATVTITNLVDTGIETLAATPSGALLASDITYTAPTLTISKVGGAALADFQVVLQSVTYNNTSQNPNITARSITFLVNDGAANSNVVTKIVTVTTVNDAPSFTGSNQAVSEDAGAQTVTSWATFNPGAPAESGQSVAAYTVSNVSNGALFSTLPAVAIDGTLTYTPAANASGSSTFDVTVQDDGGTANGGVDTSLALTFTITVGGVNDPPVAGDDAMDVVEGGTGIGLTVPPGQVTVLFNDSDPDSGQTLSVTTTPVSGPSNGSVTLNADGTLSYTHNGSETTTDSFVYEVCDNGIPILCDTATVTITVAAQNDAPVIDLNGPAVGVDYAATFTEGTPVVIVDGAQLTVGDPDDTNIEGATVTVTNVLDAGVETLTATTGATAITANYVAPLLTLSGSDTLANYQQVLRTVTYNNTAPNPNPTARVVQFVVNDGTVASAIATSTVTVNAINTAPSFTLPGNPSAVNEDAGVQTVNSFATAISDGDGDTQTLTFNVTGNTNASLFSAGPSLDPLTGNLTYTPALNANGTATITVTLSDNGSNVAPNVNTSAPQSFTITVTAVNDAPSFTGANQTVDEDAGAQTVNPWATSISAGPTDEASQTLTFTITGNTNAGLFSVLPAINPSGVLTYTPAANANGGATITVTLTDSGSNTAPNVNTSVAQNFTITVNAVNDAPSFTAGSNQTVNEDAGAQSVGWATAINDGDPEVAQTLTFNITGNDNPGLFSAGPAISATGVLTYTPAANANGSASITLTLSDNGSNVAPNVNTSGAQGFTITVNPVNDPPLVTVPGPFAVTGNVSIAVPAPGLLTTVSDPADGAGAAPFTVSSAAITSTQGGAVSVDTSTGAFTYNPPAGYDGADSFTYQVCDSGVPGSACTAATVNLTISDMLWFIDNAAAAGDGRLSSPFNTLAAFQAVNDGVGNHPVAGDNIFLNESATAYVGPVTLLNNQKLIGQDATASVATIAGITLAPNSVALPVTNSGNGVIVTLTSATDAIRISNAASNTLRGFTIGNVTATGTGINMASGATTFGTLTILDTGINTNGRALNLTTGTLTATFTGITSTGGANNLNLNTIAGTSTLGTGALSGATGTAFNVSGGTTTLSYSGTLAQASASQRVLDVTNHSTGTLTLSGAITASNGSGIGFSNADGVYTLSGVVTLNGGDAGIDVSGGSAGMITLANTGSVITNPSGIAVDIDGSSAGFTFSFAGNITKTNNATTAIDVTNNTNGTISFTGTSKTLSTSTATAVNLATNTGSTIGFSNGGLGITTTSGTGFNATGGAAAINVTGSGNTITSGAGTALNVNNSTIGGSGLTFRSISANGGSAAGITLQNTGAIGGLVVTGNGAAGTGGTIANKSGANVWSFSGGIPSLNGTTDGVGVYLNNTRGTSLGWMQLNDFSNAAVLAFGSANFSMGNTVISGINGEDAAQSESAVFFYNLTGTGDITNSTIGGGNNENLYVLNTSGTLNRLTVSGSTFNFNSTAEGNNNILIESRNAGTTLNFTLKSSTIKGARADWINVSNNSSSIGDTVIGGPLVADGNTFDNLSAGFVHPGAAAGGNRVVFGGVGNSTVDIRNNTMEGSKGEAIRVRSTATGATTGTVNARVRNNTIGVAGMANSGSSEGSGILAFGDGGGDMIIAITDNIIRQYNNHGISLTSGDEINDGSSFQVTVTGNSVSTPGNINSDFNGFHLNNGTVGATDNFTTCLDLSGNTLTGSGNGTIPPNNQEFRLRQRQATTVRLPGYAGANNNDAAVVSYIQGRNTVTAANGAASNTVPTGGGFIGGAACTLP